MSVLVHFLVATSLIATLIVIRVFANRYTLRHQLDCSRHHEDCAGTECAEKDKGSACHAP
jgi:hypothetical protein